MFFEYNSKLTRFQVDTIPASYVCSDTRVPAIFYCDHSSLRGASSSMTKLRDDNQKEVTTAGGRSLNDNGVLLAFQVYCRILCAPCEILIDLILVIKRYVK
jgi:hypothetical protein